MSLRRHCALFRRYSDSPERNRRRVIVTSEYSVGRMPLVLSVVRETSDMPSGMRERDPLKMTFSITSERSVPAFCSPNAQRIASTTFVFPQPLGPTIDVMPESNFESVRLASDL